MNLIRAALRAPQLSIVLTAFLVLAGISALFTMPRREDPKITIRTGLVSAVYPGATSEQVEAQVTRKIEEDLFHFAEVRRAKTFSTTRNGLVIVNVELNESVRDADAFWSRLRLEMAHLKTELPEGVEGPEVDSDFGDTVAVLIGVHGGHYGYRELTDYAKGLETALRALPEVAKIHRIGDQQEQIQIAESQQKLAQYGVNPQHVMQALASRASVQYAGRIPAGGEKAVLDTGSHFSSLAEIGGAIVDQTPAGLPIYLKDIAEVRRVYEDPGQYVRIDGEPSILLSVEMQEGHNIVAFGDALQARLNEVRKTLPPDLHLNLIANQPRVVGERVGDFFREFAIAILAVILVTMLLLPMRVAFVASVAIPVTVAVTFAALNAAGIELHQVSIAALIVVLGMVVDDAIVIADNYVELLDHGVARDDAAWRCAAGMAIPVLTATLTIMASFAPLLILSGSTGEFIHALPITVCIALAISFMVAMLLTPLTARTFIRSGLHARKDSARPGRFAILDRLQHLYRRAIGWAMEHRKTVLIAAAVCFVLGLGVLMMVKSQFFPLAERDQFTLDVWLPEGAGIETTDAAVRKIEAVLQREPAITHHSSFIGSGAPRFYYNVNPQPPAENYAQIQVNTRGIAETTQIVSRLRGSLPMAAPEARIFVKELQQGDDMEAPLEVRISGEDAAELQSLADQAETVLRNTPGAAYIHSDWHEAQLQTGVHLQEEQAARLGFSDANVAQQLAIGLEGYPVAWFWEGDRHLPITLRGTEAERRNFESVSNAYVQSPLTGASLPLQSIATITPEWQPGRIVRRGGLRTLTVRAFADHGYLPSQVLSAAQAQLRKIALPPGYRIEYGGEDENQRETSGEMNRALAISLVLIFLTMLFQFRTIADPLIIMTAFPLALPGAALGLFLTGNPFGFTAFIGIISLGGLVVRNSIILVDAIQERLQAGSELLDAAMEAGERRLRPIFLTTMAAAVGVTPMILSGSTLWSPMASVIAFGLLGSMAFTLLVIPVLFVAVHGRKTSRPKALMTAALLGTLLCAAAHAQSRSLTLDEALELAHSQNTTIHLAHAKIREASAKVTEARSDSFPRLTNQSNALYMGKTENLTIPQGALGTNAAEGAIPAKDVSIQLGKQQMLLSTTTAAQPLSQLFRIHQGVVAAHAEEAIARADARHAEDEVALNVKKLFYNLLALEEHRRAAELNLRAGEEKLAEARHGVEAGSALEADADEGEAGIATARLELARLEDAQADLRAELNDLLGLPLDSALELIAPGDGEEVPATSSGPPAIPFAQLAAEWNSAARTGNSELAAARATVSKAAAGVKAAELAWLPDLSLFAEHVYQNGVPLLPASSMTVGLRLDWTVADFGKRSGEVHERKAQAEQANWNLLQTENRIRINVEKGVRRLRETGLEIEAAQAAVKADVERRRIVSDQVEAKTVNASVLSEAEARLSEARAKLFEARMNRATAQAELNALTGGIRHSGSLREN